MRVCLYCSTDTDAFYDRDPRKYPDARPLRKVKEINEKTRQAAGKAGSEHATGGMMTKVGAVEIASRAECHTVLADGRRKGVLTDILNGDEVGTLFLAGLKLGARKRWIVEVRPKGFIKIDDGALAALLNRKSLLPSGITDIQGVFAEGDVVRIEDRFQAISTMNSEEILLVMGHGGNEARKFLKSNRRPEVARADDIVII